jgi:MerR family transcriptional regulator/heat shock protein HspR
MNRTPIVPREQVAERLSVPTRILIRYESRGLVRMTRDGDVEGYQPAEIRRIWSIVTLQRDLGINLAGVEAVLKLRAHMEEIHAQMEQLAIKLREAIENDADAET